MPRVEVELPDRLEVQIQQMVEQGEFLTREDAVEELLSMGVSAYDTDDDDDEEQLGLTDEMQNPGDRPMDEDRPL
jgi:Arc/MetJ-type ribon-helix-helix transcriptional regulator